METAIVILISLLIGGILGTLYFGGLWITINRFVEGRKYSRLMFITSFMVGAAIVVMGFYMLLKITHQWQLLGVALVGFVISRVIITKAIMRKTQTI